MEIGSLLTSLSSVYRRLVRRPSLLVLPLGLAILLWSGWQAKVAWLDRSITTDQVSSRLLRVNNAGLKVVTDRFDQRARLANSPSVPTNPFTLPAGS